MSAGGKGGRPRPLSVSIDKFDQSFDMIFKKRDQCGLCKKDKATCGCMATEDGPGQCDNGCPRKTPYGDAVCGDCLARSLKDGPAEDMEGER